MKLTKLFLVLASFSSLLVATGGVALADNPGKVQVTANVVGNCIVTSSGNITFVDYNPLSPDPLDATADVSIKCTVNQIPLIALDYGAHTGSGSYNHMIGSKPTDVLDYQILQPTGSGSASKSTNQWNGKTLTGTAATNLTAVKYTMYGEIYTGQNVPVGTYTDTVTVTVNL